MARILLILILCTCLSQLQAQDTTFNFFVPSVDFNSTRVYSLAGSYAVIYTGALVILNEFWYKSYPKSSFHFFDDSKEWLQMDKVGHIYTAYFEGLWSVRALEWSGLGQNKSIWYGGLTGSVLQSTIEILDGYSAKWGASWSDLAANSLGSAIVIAEEKLWGEQRILMKFSYTSQRHPEGLGLRAGDLFGTGTFETIIKDYNGQTYWLSVNPASFLNDDTKFPSWLNVAIGYGATGIYGGFENIWEVNGMTIDRTDVARTRQYYLSLDVDLTKFKTNKPFLNTLLGIINIIKIPAPALRYDSGVGFSVRAFYF